MAVKWAASMRPGLVFPFETRLGPVLSDLLRRLECYHEDLLFEVPRTLGAAIELVMARRPRVVVLDSISCTTFTADDLVSLAKASNTILLGILQNTKSGLPAGSNSFQHLADVTIRVDALRWEINKSRYQPLGVGGEV